MTTERTADLIPIEESGGSTCSRGTDETATEDGASFVTLAKRTGIRSETAVDEILSTPKQATAGRSDLRFHRFRTLRTATIDIVAVQRRGTVQHGTRRSKRAGWLRTRTHRKQCNHPPATASHCRQGSPLGGTADGGHRRQQRPDFRGPSRHSRAHCTRELVSTPA